MPVRPAWKSVIRLSLVSVPVQGYAAAERDGGDVHFNQLHAECNSRIRYKKVCPIHGEVSNDEIIQGYEYAKDHYVTLEPGELDAVRPENEKAINLHAFIKLADFDPIYFDNDVYYLLPDGKGGDKPYAVLFRAMQEEGRCGVGEAVLWGRQRLVILRPLEKVLALGTLKYPEKVRSPEAIADDFEMPTPTAAEVKLAKSLLAATTAKKFDIHKYADTYRTRLSELIEAKVKGKKIVATPQAAEEPPSISLMDALRRSVKNAKQPAKREPTKAARRRSAS